jgi:hypothetical protein
MLHLFRLEFSSGDFIFCITKFAFYLPGDRVPEHHKITAQTVKRILKRGGFIFFKKEMSKPSEAIATKRDDDKPKPFACNDTKDQANENEQSACEMQSPAYWISMFG